MLSVNKIIMFLLWTSRRHAICFSVRRVSTAHKETLYSLNDHVCPPTHEVILRKTVEKHCQTLDRYLAQKPIAGHTQDAFDSVRALVSNTTTAKEGIILDSGCGTARSSLVLGNMYPNHLIIGIDRSLARLWRNIKFRKGDRNNSSIVDGEFRKGDGNGIVDGEVPAVQRASPNVILVRAELSDFWRLCAREEWKIYKHYLLYPNPYPKKSRLKSRWYAHAAFPILLGLGGEIVVRSNWKGYLNEFAICTKVANECMDLAYIPLGPARHCETSAFTNFEQKFYNVGEPTYELTLSEGILNAETKDSGSMV